MTNEEYLKKLEQAYDNQKEILKDKEEQLSNLELQLEAHRKTREIINSKPGLKAYVDHCTENKSELKYSTGELLHMSGYGTRVTYKYMQQNLTAQHWQEYGSAPTKVEGTCYYPASFVHHARSIAKRYLGLAA